MSPSPFVSVIIPTYNRAAWLPGAVESVLAQTHRNFELIIVDDGSSDATARFVASLDHPIVYLRQDNKGPAAARNLGIKNARYDLLAFLDVDDRFVNTKLARQVAAMAQRPDALISHTQEIWYRDGQQLNQKKNHRKNSGNIFAQSLKLCTVGMSTMMARRALFDGIGLLDEDLPCCEDYDFWLRASVSHDFLLIDEPLTIKNGGRPDQVSSQYRVGMDRFRIRAIAKLLEQHELSDEKYRLACEELVRKATVYGKGCIKHGKEDEGKSYLALADNVGRPPLG